MEDRLTERRQRSQNLVVLFVRIVELLSILLVIILSFCLLSVVSHSK